MYQHTSFFLWDHFRELQTLSVVAEWELICSLHCEFSCEPLCQSTIHSSCGPVMQGQKLIQKEEKLVNKKGEAYVGRRNGACGTWVGRCRRISLAGLRRHIGRIHRCFNCVEVRFLLKLTNILLVAYSLVAKPIRDLRTRQMSFAFILSAMHLICWHPHPTIV